MIFKKVFKNAYFWYAHYQAVAFWPEIKIKKSEQQKVTPSDCEENAPSLIKIS